MIMELIMLINVKMPTTYYGMIQYIQHIRVKNQEIKVIILQEFSFYEQFSCSLELALKTVS